jgi:O-antigen ligase
MKVSEYLQMISRISFLLFFIVGLQLRTSLQSGLLVAYPILTISFREKYYLIGALFLIPLISVLTAAAGWMFDISSRRWFPKPHIMIIPAFALNLLALIRSWPIQSLSATVILVGCITLFWVTYIYCLRNWPEKWAINAFAVVALINGIVAVMQFLLQRSIGLSFLGEVTLLDPHMSGVSVIEAAGDRWLRSYGLLRHPNILGGIMGISLLICLGALMEEPVRKRWLWVAIAAASLGLFLSFSRAAWIGTILGLLYLALTARIWRLVSWHDKRIRWVLVVTLLALVFMGLLFGELIGMRLWLTDSVSILEMNSINERLRDLGQAWILIRNQPLVGVGTGNYIQALETWAQRSGLDYIAFQKVHNVPLLLAAELGLAGAVLWIWMIILPVYQLTKSAYKKPVRPTRAGLSATFLTLFVVGMLDLYLYPFIFSSALLMGVLCGIWTHNEAGGLK